MTPEVFLGGLLGGILGTFGGILGRWLQRRRYGAHIDGPGGASGG